MAARRGPPITLDNGKTCAFYLPAKHRQALDAFRRRHGHESASSALRAILDQVAIAYGVPDHAGPPRPPAPRGVGDV